MPVGAAVVTDGAVEEFHAVVDGNFWGGGNAVAVAVGAEHVLDAAFAVGHLPTATLDVLRDALGILLHEVPVGGDEVFVEDGVFGRAVVVALHLGGAGGEEEDGGKGCIYNRCGVHGLRFFCVGRK